MLKKQMLSFVIPCYRSEETIETVIEEIIRTVQLKEEYDYEIIAVNDCSPDNVYEVLCGLALNNKKIKVVNLVKNVGKHAAILAGYSFVNGEYIVNLDDDCQSPVNKLWELVEPLESGEYDVATAKYNTKKESIWKRLGSNINLFVSGIMLDKPRGLRFENLSAINRVIVDEIINYKNPYPFLEGLILRSTRKIISIPMEQRERGDGKKTGFTLRKSIALFANGFTNFSVKPLRIALVVGMLFALFGFVYGIIIIVRKIMNPSIPMGWSSLMALLSFSSGTIMLILGMIGEYIGRIFICINDSPQYVIRNTKNISE